MVKSKQVRFQTDTEGLFTSWYTWGTSISEQEPAYVNDSRVRDKWLREYAKEEPHLSGVLSTVVAIDKNRGWRMIGGRNQVNKFTNILHSMEVAPGVVGWRSAISHFSQSFWSTDMGGLLEIGRDGKNGPLRALYSLDPARCKLTGKINYPLSYYPRNGKIIPMRDMDYIRVTSLPNTDEAYNGLGFCAVSRCLDLTKLMIAIYTHDKEQLGSLAPRGLLLLNGITQRQWVDAMRSREADLEARERDYFSNVAVIASSAATVEAKLVALSQLPTGFDLREWMDMLMYGYALCFGYDPSEFYPVQFGAIGRGTETEIQHEKATGKGRLDCVLGLQEQLQMNLPDSLEFLFDQRDEKGDLLHAQVDQAWADVSETLLKSGSITIPESRVLLSQQGVIPSTWSPSPDVESTDQEDTDNEPLVDESGKEVEEVDPSTVTPVDATKIQQKTRDILLQMPRVIRAIEKYPKEPLVEYSYPENRISILAYRAEDLLGRRLW